MTFGVRTTQTRTAFLQVVLQVFECGRSRITNGRGDYLMVLITIRNLNKCTRTLFPVAFRFFLRLKGCSLSFVSVYQRKFTSITPSTQVPDAGAICKLHRSRRRATNWPFLELVQNLPWDPEGQNSGKYKMKLRCEVFYLSHVLFIVF